MFIQLLQSFSSVIVRTVVQSLTGFQVTMCVCRAVPRNFLFSCVVAFSTSTQFLQLAYQPRWRGW